MSTGTESVFLICFVLVNFTDCLTSREMGMSRLGGGKFFTSRLNSEYGTRHMLSNSLLKETPVTVPNMNKVFCSQWLSDRQVVFGTKCNKVTYTLDHYYFIAEKVVLKNWISKPIFPFDIFVSYFFVLNIKKIVEQQPIKSWFLLLQLEGLSVD